MTNADWWTLFEEHQADVRALVEKYHPTSGQKHSHRITAARAEVASENVRNKILREAKVSGIVAFDAALQARDANALAHILNGAWFGMPESEDVRHEPGFFALCDLCIPPEEAEVQN